MNTTNQCQGCQAGWPIEQHKPWPPNWQPDTMKTIAFHIVVGGYKGEKCLCTKHLYEIEENDKSTVLPATAIIS